MGFNPSQSNSPVKMDLHDDDDDDDDDDTHLRLKPADECLWVFEHERYAHIVPFMKKLS